ncbi:hypothetical protein Hamer_G014826 [Homarus americanus]|uniref:Uncharacterized protein n=1 Tax=Homarus americanus TaxID=6706 RepID=A0A8J5JL03_HOMAM|nr:hypothetical protein Hamer_G014826 [Homarus americanus]
MCAAEELEQPKKRRKTAKWKFTRKVNLMKEGFAKENPKSVLTDLYQQVSQCFDELENINEKYITLLSESGCSDEELLDEANNYITEVERIKVDMQVQLARYGKYEEKPLTRKISIKALDLPKFRGHMRDYPALKVTLKG